MTIQEYMLEDPDAIIVATELYDHDGIFGEPLRVWQVLKELGEMWNRNDEEEYMFYVEGYWQEV